MPRDDEEEQWLDMARNSATRYFGRVTGRSKRLRRGGYRLAVTAGKRNERCSVTVALTGPGTVSLLFSPKPAWALSTFSKLVTDRMGSDIDGEVPSLTYGANQGRFGVHVPTSVRGRDFQTAVYCICSMYDASGPLPGQVPPGSEYLECMRHALPVST
jgi:hypothetical protein